LVPPPISTTEKETLVKSRIGQGRFREDVLSKHIRCPFTGVEDPRFLKAGHLKPWVLTPAKNTASTFKTINTFNL